MGKENAVLVALRARNLPLLQQHTDTDTQQLFISPEDKSEEQNAVWNPVQKQLMGTAETDDVLEAFCFPQQTEKDHGGFFLPEEQERTQPICVFFVIGSDSSFVVSPLKLADGIISRWPEIF